MKKTILIGLFIMVLIIVGCENIDVSQVSDEDLERISDKAVICNKPYIRVGMECCLDQNDNSICDSDEIETTQLSEIELVEDYINDISVQTLDEYISNTKNSLNYVTGYAKDYLEQTLTYLTEKKKIFNEFYNAYWEKCIEVKARSVCEQIQRNELNALNSAVKTDISIIKIELKEEGVVHTEREQTTRNSKNTVIRDYLLKKEDGSWKIYDNINEDGTKWSDTPIKEIILNDQETINKQKSIYDEALKNIAKVVEAEDDSTPETLEITTGEASSNGLKFDVSLTQNGESITYKDAYGDTQTSSAMEGMKLLRFDITVESLDGSKSFYTTNFVIMDEEGNTYEIVCPLDFYGVRCVNADGLDPMYSPIEGQKKKGLLTYQIPLNMDKVYLVYKFSKYDEKPRVLKFVFDDV